MAEKILQVEYAKEMKKAYLDYSMSVITARALPDIRDGLKPVQRRILYDMNELNLSFDKPHRKSARIVGDTMAKYHPHGDTSIYDTLVVLSQTFKKNYPLIDSHGNFGSIEGDSAAAMRYTEAKLKKFTQDVYLKDLDKTVNFVSNYDETEKEPEVLPAKIPSILLNGAEGIAVGMATSIAPHNLGELIDTCIAYIKNNLISTKELLDILKGPDFPTGGIISNKADLLEIYEKGAGKLKLRAKIEVELARKKQDKDKLIVSEIPYTMIGLGINKFLNDVIKLIENRELTGIVDISNQSDKDGVRIVLELKKETDIEKIKNILYKKTKLEDTLFINMLAIVDKKPEVLSLRDILKNYLDFQYYNLARKYEVLLEKEKEKKEIKEGLIKAYDVLDVIIAVLRGSKNIKDAKEALTKGDISKINFKIESLKEEAKKLNFTLKQANAILEMRLYKLISLEIKNLHKEYKECLSNIKEYEKILSSKSIKDKLIIKELEEVKIEYATKRKTLIEDSKEIVLDKEEKEKRRLVFLLDKFSYIKLIEEDEYIKNIESINNEYTYVKEIMSDDKLMIFTDKAFLHQIKVDKIPISRLKDKSIPLDNISKFSASNEKILYVDASINMNDASLLFITKKSFIKRVNSSEFISNNRFVMSSKLEEDDILIKIARINNEKTEVVLISDKNYLLRFPLNLVKGLKKTSKGEIGMKLEKGEYIKEAHILDEIDELKIGDKFIKPKNYKISKKNLKGSKIR